MWRGIVLELDTQTSHTFSMTEWIDGLVAKLSDEQKRKNVDRTYHLLCSALIEGRAPQFVNEMIEAVGVLAEEINKKLGASIGEVQFKATPGYGFNLGSTGQVSVSVLAKANLKGQQIEFTTSKKGNNYLPNSGVFRAFTFRVDDQSAMYAQENKPQAEKFYTAAELASHVLRDVFTVDLIPGKSYGPPRLQF